MITVVYPYMHQLSNGDQSNNGMCELRWSLRSLCKHARFDFNVVVVGDKPGWYNGDHISTEKIRGLRFSKAFDIANKLKVIVGSQNITDDFVYMYDDIYLVNDCELDDFNKIIALGPANRNSSMKDGSGVYKEIFRYTVKAMGLDNFYVYETHLPRVLNKQKLKLVLESYRLDIHPLLFSSIYFNEFYERPDEILNEDNKLKAGVYRKISFDSICKEVEGKLWLNHSENAFGEGMKKFLEYRFGDNCKYEG